MILFFDGNTLPFASFTYVTLFALITRQAALKTASWVSAKNDAVSSLILACFLCMLYVCWYHHSLQQFDSVTVDLSHKGLCGHKLVNFNLLKFVAVNVPIWNVGHPTASRCMVQEYCYPIMPSQKYIITFEYAVGTLKLFKPKIID